MPGWPGARSLYLCFLQSWDDRHEPLHPAFVDWGGVLRTSVQAALVSCPLIFTFQVAGQLSCFKPTLKTFVKIQINALLAVFCFGKHSYFYKSML
jgi:hypothetical protein